LNDLICFIDHLICYLFTDT